VHVIDTYVLAFFQALEENRVRCDNPSDLNTLLRLKQLLIGGADSRQEVSQAISLETLQLRHRDVLRTSIGATAAERGLPEPTPRTDEDAPAEPPEPALRDSNVAND
jgi:hypothetical protein